MSSAENIALMVNISARDSLTPVIKQIKQALNEVENSSAKAGQQIVQYFGKNIQSVLPTLDPKAKSDVEAYLNLVKQIVTAQKEGEEASGGVGGRGGRGRGGGVLSGGEGSFVGRLGRDITWGAESFLRYMIVWKALDFILQSVDKEFQEVGQDVTIFYNLNNRLGQGIGTTVGRFGELQQAAYASSTSISETFKRTSQLFEAGFEHSTAAAYASTIQRTIHDTGIDLTSVISKAQSFKATAQDVLGASQAGGPFARLEQPARTEMRRQAIETLVQFEAKIQQTAETRSFQDRVHNEQYVMERFEAGIQREMTLRQRSENEAREDMHYRINDEIEQTNRMINREMEQRHRATQRDMEDKHRAAEWAESDTERLQSRRTSAFESLPGTMDVLAGRATNKPMGYVGAAALMPQYQQGLQEMSKETGLGIQEILEAVREGMSPTVVLQFAQAAREEQRITNERKRQMESVKESRREQDEAFSKRISQEDELHRIKVQFHEEDIKMERQQFQERIDHEWDYATKRMEFEDQVYENQRDLERKFQDFTLQEEGKTLQSMFNLNLQTLEAMQQKMLEDAKKFTVQLGPAPGSILINPPTPKQTAEEQGATEKTLADVSEKLDATVKLLNQVLGGG